MLLHGAGHSGILANVSALPSSFAVSLAPRVDRATLEHGSVTWAQLVRMLTTFRAYRAKDAAPLWSPTLYPGKGTRADAGVAALSCAVFDLEGPRHSPLASDALRALSGRLEGIAAVVHQTYSGPGHFRLVLPFADPCPVGHWAMVWAGIVAAYDLPADPTCQNPSRIYFVPSLNPATGSAPVKASQEGRTLDWRVFSRPAVKPPLAESVTNGLHTPPPQGKTKTQKTVPDFGIGFGEAREGEGFPAPESGGFSLEPLLSALKAVRKSESKPIANLLLSGAPLAQEGDRDNSVNRAAGLLAGAAPPGTPKGAMMAVLERSMLKMPLEPEGEGYWRAKARSCLDRALKRREQRDQKDAAVASYLDGALDPDPDPSVVAPAPVSDAWKGKLKSTKDGTLRATAANVVTILRNDPEWTGHLRLNVVTKELDVTSKGPLAGVALQAQAAIAAQWFSDTANMDVTLALVAECIGAVAAMNPIDPLAEQLRALKWDGVPRAHTLLTRYFASTDDERYLASVSKRFLVALVARALAPGCKQDSMLILSGPQGIGKSRALGILAGGPKYFSDSKIDISTKDGMLPGATKWLIEFAELEGFKGRDAGALKQYLSSAQDYFRMPYARVAENYPRRSVCVGTTNEEEVIDDLTGARRFWMVRCGDTLDVEALKRDRDQLIAEAVALYDAGERWWMEGEEAEWQKAKAREHEIVDFIEVKLGQWLSGISGDQQKRGFTSFEAGAAILNGERVSRAEQMRIGQTLRKLGCRKKRVMGDWKYFPDAELITRLESTTVFFAPPTEAEA